MNSTVSGFTWHGKLTLKKKKEQLAYDKKRYAALQDQDTWTPKQVNLMLALKVSIPKLERSIQAWK